MDYVCAFWLINYEEIVLVNFRKYVLERQTNPGKTRLEIHNILALLLLKSDHSLFNHRSERLCALRSR